MFRWAYVMSFLFDGAFPQNSSNTARMSYELSKSLHNWSLIPTGRASWANVRIRCFILTCNSSSRVCRSSQISKKLYSFNDDISLLLVNDAATIIHCPTIKGIVIPYVILRNCSLCVPVSLVLSNMSSTKSVKKLLYILDSNVLSLS